MSEVKKQMLSHAAMNKLYRDKKAFIVNYGESMGVWTNKDAGQCKFYNQEHSPGGAGVSWSTDGQIFTLPSNSANDVDAAQFVTIDFGSSKNKVADGSNTQAYLNKIGSVAKAGAKLAAVEGAKFVGKKLLSSGVKAGAVAAGTAVLSKVLQHPEIFPSGVRPFVPVADFALNTVGKTALGMATKYGFPLVKGIAQAGWTNLVQPQIENLWNSSEPYLAATVGVPLAVYGAKKAFDGVKGGVQAIAGALKQPRVEEPSDVNEKDNMSYSSISTASVFGDNVSSDSPKVPPLKLLTSSTTDASSSVIEIDDDSPWVSNGNVFERNGSPNSFYSINSSNSSPLLPPSDENLLDLPPPPPSSADVSDFYPDRRRVIFLSFFRLKN